MTVIENPPTPLPGAVIPTPPDTAALAAHLIRLSLDLYTGRSNASDGVPETVALLRLPADADGQYRELVLDYLLEKLVLVLGPDVPACVGARNGDLARRVRYYLCGCYTPARDVGRVIHFGRRGSSHARQEFLGEPTHWLPAVAMTIAATLMHTASPYEAIDLL